MGESKTHLNLVVALVNCIAHKFFSDDTGYLAIDLPEKRASDRPPKTMGFIPDVYYSGPYNGTELLIIGEAKTASDIDNRHTRAQLVLCHV